MTTHAEALLRCKIKASVLFVLLIVMSTLAHSSVQVAEANSGANTTAHARWNPASPPRTTTYYFGALRIDVDDYGTPANPINYPMDGVQARVLVTNTNSPGGATISGIQFVCKVKETGDRLFWQPGGNFSLAPGESRTAMCGNLPGLLSLPDGVQSTRTVTFNLSSGVGWGTFDVPMTIVNWGSPQSFLVTPAPGQGMNVTVHVVDSNGNPMEAAVFARGGMGFYGGFTWSGTTRTYTAYLPPSVNWSISASAKGKQTAYRFLTEIKDYDITLTLAPQSLWFTFQRAQVLATGWGSWLNRVDGADDAILVTSGMEYPTSSMMTTVTQAKLRLFNSNGTERWEYTPGYQAWGADISRDGLWVAVASLHPTNPVLVLINAQTGQAEWTRTLDASLLTLGGSTSTVLDVREVRFAPDGNSIAIGDNNGNVILVSRGSSSPTVSTWTANIGEGNQIRAIRFSADGQTIYTAAGAGFTYALKASDGTTLWRAVSYAWVHPEGLVVSPDGTKIGILNAEGDIMMLNAATGALIWQMHARRYGWWASFSSDGTVFIAGIENGAVIGFATTTGTPLFELLGGEGGWFATGKNYFLLASTNMALYDQTGTQISDFFTGLENAVYQNWQVAWVSPDGKSVIVGQTASTSSDQPVIWYLSGQSTGGSSVVPYKLHPE